MPCELTAIEDEVAVAIESETSENLTEVQDTIRIPLEAVVAGQLTAIQALFPLQFRSEPDAIS